MKKYLLLLPALALLGAGCASATKVEMTAQDSNGTAADVTIETVTEEQKPTEASTATNAEGELVVKSDGAELVIKTDAETKSEVEEEDGIPVMEFVLGAESVNIDMSAGNFFFEPKTITAAPGEKIKITFQKNVGFHTFVIDELKLKHPIKQGEALIFTAPSTPGSYAFYCDVGSHRANGMEGVLIVK